MPQSLKNFTEAAKVGRQMEQDYRDRVLADRARF